LNTKYEILLCATKLFLEKGYTNTYVTTITNMLKISTGNLTFHFPTKEHILAELVKELCVFRRKKEEQEDGDEYSSLTAYMLELVMFASLCEENPNIRDLMLAVYTRPMSLAIIRANDYKRSMKVYEAFCKDWSETVFIQAENIVSGIEYAMFRTENAESLTFEQRVTSSLDAIMKIYEVPAHVRQSVVSRAMEDDYRTKSNLVFKEFYAYVDNVYLQEVLKAKDRG